MSASEKATNNDNQLNQFFTSLLPGLFMSDLLKDLNFVVNCEIEGEQRGERFEPKVKVNIHVARDMDKVISRKMVDAKIRKEEFETMQTIEAEKKAQQEQTIKLLMESASLFPKGDTGTVDEKAKPREWI